MINAFGRVEYAIANVTNPPRTKKGLTSIKKYYTKAKYEDGSEHWTSILLTEEQYFEFEQNPDTRGLIRDSKPVDE